MKITYKQKLFLGFVIIFVLFTAGIVVFEQSREKKFRTEILEERLDTYANIVNTSLQQQHNQLQTMDSLINIFPQHLRLTVINNQGVVLYDNALKEVARLENHTERPEIMLAEKIVADKLSVREVEKAVKLLEKPAEKKTRLKEKESEAVHLAFQQLENRMKSIMGTKVSINKKDKSKGRIEIEYYSPAELERLVELIETISQ